jgi:hypothetical protein
MSTNQALQGLVDALDDMNRARDALVAAAARLHSAMLVLRLEDAEGGDGARAEEEAECAVLRAALRADLDYECENCIGMREHGCYCKAMGARQPGGTL